MFSRAGKSSSRVGLRRICEERLFQGGERAGGTALCGTVGQRRAWRPVGGGAAAGAGGTCARSGRCAVGGSALCSHQDYWLWMHRAVLRGGIHPTNQPFPIPIPTNVEKFQRKIYTNAFFIKNV